MPKRRELGRAYGFTVAVRPGQLAAGAGVGGYTALVTVHQNTTRGRDACAGTHTHLGCRLSRVRPRDRSLVARLQVDRLELGHISGVELEIEEREILLGGRNQSITKAAEQEPLWRKLAARP